jgi:hypothetical protein
MLNLCAQMLAILTDVEVNETVELKFLPVLTTP